MCRCVHFCVYGHVCTVGVIVCIFVSVSTCTIYVHVCTCMCVFVNFAGMVFGPKVCRNHKTFTTKSKKFANLMHFMGFVPWKFGPMQ